MIERSDKKKSIDKVAASLAKNPLQSQREIAKDTWLWKTTVQERIQDVKTTKDDRIANLLDIDYECIRKWVREINSRLSDKEELKKMRTVEISQVIKENTARYAIFRPKEEWDNEINITIMQ